jgi:hypothetical protein
MAKQTRIIKLHGKYQELKECRNPGGRYVAWLNVSGLWLEKAGFNVGDQVDHSRGRNIDDKKEVWAVSETSPSLNNEADLLEREALMVKVFSYFKKALPASKKALQYLQGRSIDYGLHDIGYNSGGLHTESKNHHLVNSMVKYGLLKANAVHGYSVWAKECVT